MGKPPWFWSSRMDLIVRPKYSKQIFFLRSYRQKSLQGPTSYHIAEISPLAGIEIEPKRRNDIANIVFNVLGDCDTVRRQKLRPGTVSPRVSTRLAVSLYWTLSVLWRIMTGWMMHPCSGQRSRRCDCGRWLSAVKGSRSWAILFFLLFDSEV